MVSGEGLAQNGQRGGEEGEGGHEKAPLVGAFVASKGVAFGAALFDLLS